MGHTDTGSISKDGQSLQVGLQCEYGGFFYVPHKQTSAVCRHQTQTAFTGKRSKVIDQESVEDATDLFEQRRVTVYDPLLSHDQQVPHFDHVKTSEPFI